jgi:hypothetical protein
VRNQETAMFAWTGTMTTILMAGYGFSPPLIDGVILTTPMSFARSYAGPPSLLEVVVILALPLSRYSQLSSIHPTQL